MHLSTCMQPVSNIDLALDALRHLQGESHASILLTPQDWISSALFWLSIAKASGATPEMIQAHQILLADTLGKADGQGMVPHYHMLLKRTEELSHATAA